MITEPLTATLRERLENLKPGEFFLTGRLGRPYQEHVKQRAVMIEQAKEEDRCKKETEIGPS